MLWWVVSRQKSYDIWIHQSRKIDRFQYMNDSVADTMKQKKEQINAFQTERCMQWILWSFDGIWSAISHLYKNESDLFDEELALYIDTNAKTQKLLLAAAWTHTGRIDDILPVFLSVKRLHRYSGHSPFQFLSKQRQLSCHRNQQCNVSNKRNTSYTKTDICDCMLLLISSWCSVYVFCSASRSFLNWSSSLRY